MLIRSADLTIQDTDTNGDRTTHAGRCWLILRENDVYFRWSIFTSTHLLASHAGTYPHTDEAPLGEHYTRALQAVIDSIHRYKQRRPIVFHVFDWSWAAPMPKTDTLVRILTTLAHIQQRPSAYIGPPSIDALLSFLQGFHIGCATAGYTISYDPESAYHAITEAQGWEFTAIKPIEEMQARGLSIEQVIRELLVIESEAWKATYPTEEIA